MDDGARPSRPTAIRAFVDMLHPAPIFVVLVAATGFCAAAVRGRPPWGRLRPLLLALTFTQLAISVHNDFCDRALDSLTKPWRPIPRGSMSPGAALTLAGTLLGLGLVAVAPLGGVALTLVAVGTGAGLAYNAYFKRSLLTWLPFWIGLPTLPVCSFVAMQRFKPRLALAYLVGAPLVLGVYLADSMSDVETDRVHGVRGLAPTLGPERTRVVCWTSVASAIVLAIATRRQRSRPGPLYFLATGFLAIAPVLDHRRSRHLHWGAIMGSVIAVSIGWVNDVASSVDVA